MLRQASLRVLRSAAFPAVSRRCASQLVEVHRQGHVATVVLNAPERLNALTETMGEEFMAAMHSLKHDQSLRALVLTGAGKAFSAGGDLEFLLDRTRQQPAANSERMQQFYRRFLSIREVPVPTIAAINGAAIGAGMCLASACDLRIAATDARMGYTFATLGLHPGMAATHNVPRLIGPQLAARLLLTGEIIDGEEAGRIGLVSKVVPRDQVRSTAEKLAQHIATNCSPVAVRATTQTLRATQDVGLQSSLQREADGQAHSYASPDILEGIQAVRDKRPAKYA